MSHHLPVAELLRHFIYLLIGIISIQASAFGNEYRCLFAAKPPVIDGHGTDEAWAQAEVISHFRMAWLGELTRPENSPTEAKVLWDREYFYFWAKLKDTDLKATLRERDSQTWNDDCFEIFLKPSQENSGYYEFHVTPANTQMDLFIPARQSNAYQKHKNSVSFQFESAVHVQGTIDQENDTDTEWEVEGRIAWKDFAATGGRPEAGEQWTFSLCRYDYDRKFPKPHLTSIAPLTEPSFHQHEKFCPLTFLGPAQTISVTGSQTEKPDLLSHVKTSRVVGSPDPIPPFSVEKIWPNLAIDLPISLRMEPKSPYFWLITQQGAYGPSAISRYSLGPTTPEQQLVVPADNDTVHYDLCFHPNFPTDPYLFVGANGKFGGSQRSRITRYRVAIKPDEKVELVDGQTVIEWESNGHNGAALTFGLDGMLYITSGDGTSDSDTNLRGQDLTELTAKVLRIDVSDMSPDGSYKIPTDNPFVGREKTRPETYAYGLRNPWRITTDSQSGLIWIGQNGQDLWEQVYLLEKGANYGWSVMEGNHPFYIDRQRGPDPIRPPVKDHHHSEARSLTGGIVYRGKQANLADLVGAYIYGDYSTGKIWALWHDGKRLLKHQEIADTSLAITAFEQTDSGEIWILDHLGRSISRLVPQQASQQPTKFPLRLSDSGLFTDVAAHTMAPGVIPYSVNSPLWSDGAHKARWFAIPEKDGTDQRIEFQNENGWTFPNETVLIKSFAIEQTVGDPKSRRWIETRFMVRQQNEWVGYSYRWNKEGTDATLVSSSGEDAEYTIVDKSTPGHKRTLKWHYPSRAECMVCHSRAANFTLGLQTAQINKLHDYGVTTKNQLEVLEQLGLLKVNSSMVAQSPPNLSIEFRSLPQRQAPRDSALLPTSPDKLPRLANPYDHSEDLAERARAYLHSNCSSCHIPAGGGNATMDLRYNIPLAQAGVLDELPKHQRFDIDDAKLVASGNPDRSVLLKRMSIRGNGQMPQLATEVIDQAAVDLIRQWISSLPQP